MSTADSPVIEKKPETVISPPPKMFNVVVRNNKDTQMEFVVNMLTKVFNISVENAVRKMLEVHKNNRAHFGPFTKDVAETKKDQCMEYAANAVLQQNKVLITTIEPAP